MKLLGVRLWIWWLVIGAVNLFIAVDYFSKADLVGAALAGAAGVLGLITSILQRRVQQASA